MIDTAGSNADIWHALFERLRQEPSLKRLLGAEAAACLVSAAGETVLATPALRVHVAAGWPPATVKRLQALAAGLAPRSGLRLERITFGEGPNAVSRTMATRRVRGHDGSSALLLVDVGARVPAPAVPHAAPDALGAGAAGPGAAADAAAFPVALPTRHTPAAEAVPPPQLRVLYESDAQGRIGRIDASLPRLLGQPADALEGQLWSDLIGMLVADTWLDDGVDAGGAPAGLAAAVLRDCTFSNRPTLWRLATGDGTLGERAYAGKVSGLPMHDAQRRFLGHRGFILIDTTATLNFPAARAAPKPEPLPEPEAIIEGASTVPQPANDVAEAIAEAVTAPIAGGNVVPLRLADLAGSRSAASAATAARRSEETGQMSRLEAEPAPPSPSLSLSERNAFREIARALGARFDEGGQHSDGQHSDGQRSDDRDSNDRDGDGRDGDSLDTGRRTDTGRQIPWTDTEGKPTPDHDATHPSRHATTAEPVNAHARADSTPPPAKETPDGQDTTVAARAPDRDGMAQDDMAKIAPDPATFGVNRKSHVAVESDNIEQVGPEDRQDGAPVDGPDGGNIVRLVPPPRPDPYQDLVDRLPMGVLVMRDGRALFANRTLLDLIGYDSVAALNESGVDRLFAGGHGASGPLAGGPLWDGPLADGVVTLRTRDGDAEPVDARLSCITFAGEPATLMAFRRALETVDAARVEAARLDVARAEQQARELSAILDTATDGVLTLDAQGRLLSLNRSAEALFGYDQREVIGENFTMLLAPESHLTALDYLEGLKGGGVASLLNDGREVVGRVRQGGRIPLSMTMGRVAEGADRKFSVVLRDMTAWKRAETDLVEARRVAERASDQKSEVLAKISHEIRTPLNAIIGFTEVMSEERFGPIGNDRYKEYLQDIHQSGAYLISLVNDLLDLAKIEAGRMEMSFAAVNLNDLIQQTVSLMQPEASRQRVVLRTGLHPRLPPVVADERSLRQIVLNLLSNAIKFTDPGGQVIISTKLGDRGELALSVRDTGIGMTEKELQQALEPFRQVSATRRGHGTGLGLPITKALVEANKGALAISSARNEGTLVEITFPPQRVLAS